MVARGEKPVRSANAGEASEDFRGRIDVKQYYSAALRMKGFEPVPQGGFRLMPGSRCRGPARRPLSPLAVTSPSTSPGPHTGTQTIWSGTVAATVALVQIDGMSVDAGTMLVTAQVQLADLSWVSVGPAVTIGQNATNRTIAFAPRQGRAAVAARLRAVFSESATATIGTVGLFSESGTPTRPRYRDLRQGQADGYFIAVHAGFCDIWRNDAFVACVRLPSVTAGLLPDLDFYAEASTFGIFHEDLETVRIRRVLGNDHEWVTDPWPYDGIPTADFGGSYAKTDDIWEIFIRWAIDVEIYLQVTVDDEDIAAVPVRNNLGDPTTPPSADWPGFAAEVEAALQALPSLGPDVSVSESNASGTSRRLTVTFDGALAGREYNLTANVVNTAQASALPFHIQFGETDLEPVISATRGWPGSAALVQDRLGYNRFKSRKAAVALSEVAEYFRLNIEASGPNAARFDGLRTETAETVLKLKEAKYLLVFTDEKVWFATNRAISATEPPNYVVTYETGIRKNTEPVEIDQRIYFVSADGEMIHRAGYDEIEAGFVADRETIINSHLVSDVLRTARQAGAAKTDATRMWILRGDGRLVQGQTIRSQDIFMALAEWLIADGGVARELGVDPLNQVCLCIERDGDLRHEVLDQTCLFQQAVTRATDLGGVASALPYPDGTTVWAQAEGFVFGPFTVAGGAIDLGDSFASVLIGRWIAPVYEDMPHVFVLPSDEVVWRPGRIHTVSANVIDTTSIAIGANGEPAEDFSLVEATDPLDQPMPGKTRLLTCSGITGSAIGTTVVFTQVRPGRCRVRDYSTGEKL